MRRHPSPEALRTFAERDGSGGEEALRHHLARCARCRAEIHVLRRMRAALLVDAAPPLPAEAFAQVLARRAAGERVILPEVVPLAAPRARGRAAVGAAAVVLGALAIASQLTSSATAAVSELRFSPTEPRAGALIRVAYRAGPLLAAEDTLVLRARYRTAAGKPYEHGSRQHVAGRLVRGADGVHHGELRLPAAVVFAAFAVEDRAGERVDHNGERFWLLELHGEDGRPLLAALDQHLNDLHGRGWDAMHAVARRMATLFPDDPRAWRHLRWLDGEAAGPEARDSVEAAHRARIARIHAHLADEPDLPADVIGAMLAYGNPAEHNEYWRARLLREHPHDPNALFFALAAAQIEGGAAAFLAAAEDAWQALDHPPGAGHELWIGNAVARARQTGDAVAAARWTQRLLEHGGVSAAAALEYMAALARPADAGPQAAALLRRWLSTHAVIDDATRPLQVARPAHARERAQQRRTALAALGGVLLAGGDTAAGLAALRTATEAGWDGALFAAAARALLAAGDTAAALQRYALTRVDPVPPAEEHPGLADAAARFDAAAWRGWLHAAHERFQAEMLADTAPRPLQRGAIVVDRAGRRHDFNTLLGRRLTVVTYMLPQASGATPWLGSQIDELHGWLRARGVALIALAGRSDAPALERALAELGTSFPLYYDPQGEARAALQSFVLPAYWVVDGSGVVLFGGTDPSAARRQVAAWLAHERRLASAASQTARAGEQP